MVRIYEKSFLAYCKNGTGDQLNRLNCLSTILDWRADQRMVAVGTDTLTEDQAYTNNNYAGVTYHVVQKQENADWTTDRIIALLYAIERVLGVDPSGLNPGDIARIQGNPDHNGTNFCFTESSQTIQDWLRELRYPMFQVLSNNGLTYTEPLENRDIIHPELKLVGQLAFQQARSFTIGTPKPACPLCHAFYEQIEAAGETPALTYSGKTDPRGVPRPDQVAAWKLPRWTAITEQQLVSNLGLPTKYLVVVHLGDATSQFKTWEEFDDHHFPKLPTK
mmetsp:Transcript_60665/g.69306  ORF Transcript_60665/g.69306 Transcript_60665/m.69306 type:complete len:277 (+) Transcript_60665:241-1071(+)|eukprot:CAMPEP_0115008080 /NCGR_PEP_ID=MMETSP0216-20121206/21661_1 /TAXON_ID=223996 /ORGANISM="Protocruzia adherens, Strain Boccale" /LENGTH=276 /DNA_ID=CAMNT_0002375343 /DNA_START=228 /DNA_END=1058 /DNA_ORIENTATION=+